MLDDHFSRQRKKRNKILCSFVRKISLIRNGELPFPNKEHAQK